MLGKAQKPSWFIYVQCVTMAHGPLSPHICTIGISDYECINQTTNLSSLLLTLTGSSCPESQAGDFPIIRNMALYSEMPAFLRGLSACTRHSAF